MSYTIYCFLLFPVFQRVKRDTSGKKNHKGKLYRPFLAGLPDKKTCIYTVYGTDVGTGGCYHKGMKKEA